MVFSFGMSGSTCATRNLCCSFIIICAFIATFLAGIHLEAITGSTNFVIPLYGRALVTTSSKSLNKFDDVRKSNGTPLTPAVGAGVELGLRSPLILESDCATRNITSSNITAEDDKDDFFEDRVNVLIFAAMRTGSSYIGELLARRPDFFYLFEPGLRLQSILKLKNLTQAVHMTKYLEMLDGIYRCNYTNLDYFLKYSSWTDYDNQRKHIPGLMDPKTCYFWRKVKNKTRRFCAPINQTAAETKCAMKKNIGIKTIRIHDLNLLLPLILDKKEVKLKVIHLVRDPRGMVASRLMLYYHTHTGIFPHRYFGNPMKTIVDEYCSTWLKNIEIGRYVKELRKSYLLLRYEDAANDPVGTARKIYSFLGLGGKIPSKVTKWILNNTSITNPKSSPYSTQRDSRATSEQWRSKLTYETIKMVEHTGKCRDLMDSVGYIPVYDENDLNKSELSFVEGIPTFDSWKIDNYFNYS